MNPVLVHRLRGPVVESFHRGAVCVVNDKNEIIYSLGDTDQICYPRSAMKYFQHIPLILKGLHEKFNFSESDIAIMCASHNGEKVHTDKVREILEKLGLQISDLHCGNQEPNLHKDKVNLYESHQKPNALHNNCSGKHAGFLAYCLGMDLPTASYLNEKHALQVEIKKIVAKFYQCNISELMTGVDGCSAPMYSGTVYQQAIGYRNLCTTELLGDPKLTMACNLLLKSIAANPYLIAGENRYCSDLIKITNGKVIGKTGADGVYSAVVPSLKIGICIKIDDGTMGPQYTAMQHLLKGLGILTNEENAALENYRIHNIKNWNKVITGTVEPNPQWDIKSIF